MDNNATSTAALGQLQGLNQNFAALVAAFKNAFVGNVGGSFTMPASATYTVTNTSVTASSRIFLTPVNAAAGTLQGSAKCLYVTAANGNFVVATASGVAAAGTEHFQWTAG